LVHRRLSAVALLSLALAAALALAAPALGANQRIAIGHYRWSNPEVHVDLGEHVTWYWVGPDTMHSVTGVSPNDQGLDSDAGNDQPRHAVGSSFQLSFNTPGTYSFQCKLHSVVHGEVVVSSTPGDPNAEPDPVPPNDVDLNPPHLSDVKLDSTAVSASGGTRLLMGLNERGAADAEIYRINGREHRKDFAGWQSWKTYVGFNHVRFGDPSKHFKPRPGNYVAKLRATDGSNNTTKPQTLRFSIR
jgi:plastocyanin